MSGKRHNGRKTVETVCEWDRLANYRWLTQILSRQHMNMEGMPMTISELSRSRPAAESSSKPRLRATIGSLITRVRLWLSKPFSFAFARVLMIFLVGFAAGIAWQSYGGGGRKTIAR